MAGRSQGQQLALAAACGVAAAVAVVCVMLAAFLLARLILHPFPNYLGPFPFLVACPALLAVAGAVGGKFVTSRVDASWGLAKCILASPATCWLAMFIVFFAWDPHVEMASAIGVTVWCIFPSFYVTSKVFAARGLLSRTRSPGMCAECGYNLTGNVTGICPECGTAIPEEQHRSESS